MKVALTGFKIKETIRQIENLLADCKLVTASVPKSLTEIDYVSAMNDIASTSKTQRILLNDLSAVKT
jgi:hypothetical protein